MTGDPAGYRLERRLGRGGGAEVWLAWPIDAATPVAVKRLAPRGATAPGDMSGRAERLRAEGRVLADVAHPHLVALLDVVDDPSGVALVLPYLAGGSLRDLLDDRGTLSAGELLAVIGPVAGALGALLDRGTVHGDCKPENVLFTSEGSPVLVDIGAARPVGERSVDGVVVGTPDYLDPALSDGEPATPATDVFSLGVVAYEALTGRRPHRGEPAEVLAAAGVGAHRPLASWPTVAPGVAEVIERAMAPDPAHRPIDASALVDELRQVIPLETVRLPGPARTGPVVRRPERLDTLRVVGPSRPSPPGEVGPRARRVHAVRVAVVAASVALAVWAGPDRADGGPGPAPAPGHGGSGSGQVGHDPRPAGAPGGADAGPR